MHVDKNRDRVDYLHSPLVIFESKISASIFYNGQNMDTLP